MREHTEQPESIYILQLQHGDKKSFETLFDQYYIPLVDYAYRLLHDRDAAKDIIQDIFFQLWDKHSDLNIKTSLHSYLYKMVYTKCISFYTPPSGDSKIYRTFHARHLFPRTDSNTGIRTRINK